MILIGLTSHMYTFSTAYSTFSVGVGASGGLFVRHPFKILIHMDQCHLLLQDPDEAELGHREEVQHDLLRGLVGVHHQLEN